VKEDQSPVIHRRRRVLFQEKKRNQLNQNGTIHPHHPVPRSQAHRVFHHHQSIQVIVREVDL